MMHSSLGLRLIDTASLSDANKALAVLAPTIRPLVPGLRMAGRAVTANANDDLMSVIGALEIAGPGDVLVVAAGDRGRGGVGRAVRHRGVPSRTRRDRDRRPVTRYARHCDVLACRSTPVV